MITIYYGITPRHPSRDQAECIAKQLMAQPSLLEACA